MEFTFTIIIPYYNCFDYIGSSIQSIVLNKYNLSKIQILIINDGSSDNINKIIKEYQNNYKGINIECYQKTNGNWGSVINYCKHNNLIKGKYFTILDADDMLNKKTLHKALFFFDKYSVDAIIFDVNFYDIKMHRYLGKIHTFMFPWSRLIQKKRCFFSPIGIPLGKFYRSELLYKIPDLLEQISFMDTPFFNYMMTVSSKIYFSKYSGGKYRTNRNESSETILRNSSNKFLELTRVLNLLNKIVPNDAYNVFASQVLNHSYINNFRKICPSSKISVKNNLKFNYAGFWVKLIMLIKFWYIAKKNKDIIDIKSSK